MPDGPGDLLQMNPASEVVHQICIMRQASDKFVSKSARLVKMIVVEGVCVCLQPGYCYAEY